MNQNSELETSVTSGISEEIQQRVRVFQEKDQISSLKGHPIGLGVVGDCLVQAIEASGIETDKVALVSGIAGFDTLLDQIELDAFQTTYGRAIPFATGMKLANPDLKVVVLGTEMDLFSIGGSHFIQAARRNMDLTVICMNTLPIYWREETVLEEGEEGEAGELDQRLVLYSKKDRKLNLPNFADMAKAQYVARWTGLHWEEITQSITCGLNKPGFAFIEVLVPWIPPDRYGFPDEDPWAMLKVSYEFSETQQDIDTRLADLNHNEKLYVGQFIDKEAADYMANLNVHFEKRFGDKYQRYVG